jgi:hypothetical protein
MDRYYVDSTGGRGWAKVHVVCDRSTVPHTVVRSKGRWHMAKRATVVRACAELNAAAEPFWDVTPNERDSLTRLRDWAASTRAFTDSPYDPNAAPALVREAA